MVANHFENIAGKLQPLKHTGVEKEKEEFLFLIALKRSL